MAFRPGELRIFDRAGRPLGSLSGWSLAGPPSYRINDVEDFAFSLPRNDGSVPIITSASAPWRVGVSQLVHTSVAPMAMPHPRGAIPGDTLIAVISYNPNGTAATPLTPTGWTLVAHARQSNSVGVALFTRRLSVGDPASTAFAFSGTATRMSSTVLAIRGLSGRIGGTTTGIGAAATTSSVRRPAVTEASSLTVVAFANWGGSVMTEGSGGYTRQTYASHTNLIALVGAKVEPSESDPGDLLTATSTSTSYAALSVTFEPSPSVERLLRRDNLVYVGFDQPGMRGWGGYIDDVTYRGGVGQVSCLGTAGLMGGLSSSLIEQDEGDAKSAALRLVEAANAKQSAHGDLLVGFSADATRQLHGRFSYEGDVLKGLQSLADRSVSEFWMESWVGSDGRFNTRVRWGSLYEVDRTATVLPSGGTLTLRDGVGGNLTPDTEVSFSGAERVNRARLVGAQTNIGEYLDYPSVMGLFSDVVPEAAVTIPEPEMPGARRREALDLSVDWGLSLTAQKGLAQTAQNTYLGYYKRFLYAYHARFGMPFLEGFDWPGPEPDQFSKLSQRHFRTYPAFGRIGQRDVVTNWDPEDDADVTLEGWHFVGYLSGWPGTGIVGVAYDFTDPQYRWVAFRSFNGVPGVVASVRAMEPHDHDPDSDWKATGPSETIKGVASSALRPNTVWVLTSDVGRSWVREWDVGTSGQRPELASAWSIPGTAYSGLSIDLAHGSAWLVTTASGDFEKRDISGGGLLETFPSGIGSGRGISVNGDVAYVSGPSKVEMRFTKDGAWAGGKNLDAPVRAMFVDPGNNAVWLVEEKAAPDWVRVYSAAIAVYEVGAPGPVDGAPGFDAISKGQFVRVVMSDTRDVGTPQESGQRGLLPVLHRNQHGRYMPSGKAWLPKGERDGERWREWPASWGKNYNRQNCSYAAGAMLLDRHTRGTKRKTPPEMREAANDRAGDNNFAAQERAWKALGEDFNSTGYNPGKWNDLIDMLREGRGVTVKTDFDGIPEAYRCQAGYDGDHQLYLHRLGGDGTIVAHDPLCPRPKRIPIRHIKNAAGLYVAQKGGFGRAEFGWSRDTTRKSRPVDDGTARSFFIVWSEGKWVEEAIPGAPGDSAVLAKRWDPGDQKDGFKLRDDVVIADPAQVVHGEEGRVADWDPVSMGYGRNFTGDSEAYYSTKSGDNRWSKGWHLVPWDVPLSTFTFGQPEWPEGRPMLRAYLDRFNREQGTQVLGVVNVDSVWSHIELGGIYNLSVSLQGPEGGIVGRVRVVQFTPDPTSGVMQCLCEWVG